MVDFLPLRHNKIGQYAWYVGNSAKKINNVGEKSPNEWGLFDMSGNVWEWCQDWYGNYNSSLQIDPTGTVKGSLRVVRGGSWDSNEESCRSARRRKGDPINAYTDVGFRLALSVIE